MSAERVPCPHCEGTGWVFGRVGIDLAIGESTNGYAARCGFDGCSWRLTHSDYRMVDRALRSHMLYVHGYPVQS